MTTPTTINLQIDRFCNCKGCIEKVKTTLRELGGVKLLAMEPDNGKFTVLTSKHPGIIQYALHKKLKKDVNIQQETGIPDSFSVVSNPRNLITPSSQVTPQGNINVDDMANALVTISRAKGLQSVEYTQSNAFRINFANADGTSTSRPQPTSFNVRGSKSNDVFPLPPVPPPSSTIKPSAPLLPTSPDQVYGYPPEFYGLPKSSTNDYNPHGCCTIL